MAKHARSLVTQRRGEMALSLAAPPLDLQHLWFRLNMRRIRTLAFVPVEEKTSTLAIAQGIAQVAAGEPLSRVLVVNASVRACRPGAAPEPGELPAEGLPPTSIEAVSPNCDFVDFGKLDKRDAERALRHAPQLLDYLAADGNTYSTAVFAVDSVLYDTRGVPLVRNLDGCVLCVSLGKTSFEAARQMMALVGREKMMGSVALT